MVNKIYFFCKPFFKQIPFLGKLINERDYFINKTKQLEDKVVILEKENSLVVNQIWVHKYLVKFIGFIKNQKKIKTLILGSSHGDYSISSKIPFLNTYNLCLPSQDLYYSYNLYKTVKSTNLKNVILFFSVFSPGFDLIKTSEYQRCFLYKLIFNIPYKNKLSIDQKNEEIKYKKYIDQIKNNFLLDDNYVGCDDNNYFSKINLSVKDRAIKHLRENNRNNNQIRYIKDMNSLIERNNQKLIIVIPPTRNDYKKILPKSTIIFQKLFEFSKMHNIKILNYYDINLNDSNFWDTDHLNEKGAKKITKDILKAVNNY